MINGSDLRDLATKLNEGLLRAVQAARRSPERELYDLVLLPGNQVRVYLDPHVVKANGWVEGELTQVADAGLCLSEYVPSVSDEGLLRLVPYSSILCVIELPLSNDDDDDDDDDE